MMGRKIYMGLLITALLVGAAGCGKTEDNTTGSSTSASVTSGIDNTPDNTVTSSNTAPEDTKAENKASSKDDKKQGNKTAKLTASEQYSDTNRTINVLGLKEYSKIESESYTDKPSKGKKFLVLFLSIKNDSSEDNYINYNYISAKIDGKDTEHTAVFNAPENYPTIFDTVKAGKTSAGFIVWEVPSGWKKLEMFYDGWKHIDNVSLEAEFTPEDLSDPVEYNANDYM